MTKDVPDYALVKGNPARISGYVCYCGEKIEFTDGNASCKCGKKYSFQNGSVKEI